jgi:hypothetical protein
MESTGRLRVDDIITAQCTCIAGMGMKCWHVAALCYLIQTLPRQSIIPTDELKSWGQGKKV